MGKTFEERFPQLIEPIKKYYSMYKSIDEWRKNPLFVFMPQTEYEEKNAKLVSWEEIKQHILPTIKGENRARKYYPNIILLPFSDGFYYHAIIDIDNHDEKYIASQWTSEEEFNNALPLGMKRTLHNDEMCLYWEHSFSDGRNAWCLMLSKPYLSGEIPQIAKSEHLSEWIEADPKQFEELHKRTIYNNNGHINHNVCYNENREFYEVRLEEKDKKKKARDNYEKKNSVIREGKKIVDRVRHIFVPNLYYELYSASQIKDGLFEFSSEHRIFDTMGILNVSIQDVERNFERVNGKNWKALRAKPPYQFDYPDVEKLDYSYIGEKFSYKFFAKNDGYKDHFCYIVTTGRGKSQMLVELTKHSKNNIILTYLNAVVYSYEGKQIAKKYSDGRETIALSEINNLEQIEEGKNYYGTVQKMTSLLNKCKDIKTINNVCRLFHFHIDEIHLFSMFENNMSIFTEYKLQKYTFYTASYTPQVAILCNQLSVTTKRYELSFEKQKLQFRLRAIRPKQNVDFEYLNIIKQCKLNDKKCLLYVNDKDRIDRLSHILQEENIKCLEYFTEDAKGSIIDTQNKHKIEEIESSIPNFDCILCTAKLSVGVSINSKGKKGIEVFIVESNEPDETYQVVSRERNADVVLYNYVRTDKPYSHYMIGSNLRYIDVLDKLFMGEEFKYPQLQFRNINDLSQHIRRFYKRQTEIYLNNLFFKMKETFDVSDLNNIVKNQERYGDKEDIANSGDKWGDILAEIKTRFAFKETIFNQYITSLDYDKKEKFDTIIQIIDAKQIDVNKLTKGAIKKMWERCVWEDKGEERVKTFIKSYNDNGKCERKESYLGQNLITDIEQAKKLFNEYMEEFGFDSGSGTIFDLYIRSKWRFDESKNGYVRKRNSKGKAKGKAKGKSNDKQKQHEIEMRKRFDKYKGDKLSTDDITLYRYAKRHGWI